VTIRFLTSVVVAVCLTLDVWQSHVWPAALVWLCLFVALRGSYNFFFLDSRQLDNLVRASLHGCHEDRHHLMTKSAVDGGQGSHHIPFWELVKWSTTTESRLFDSLKHFDASEASETCGKRLQGFASSPRIRAYIALSYSRRHPGSVVIPPCPTRTP